MKTKLIIMALVVIFTTACKKDDAARITINPSDTAVMFTMYSKRVPYIWKRVVNGVWKQDTIRTNEAVRFEPYDTRNLGIGYWATMNLAGVPTDSLYIRADYKGRHTEMSSLRGQSAAYVLIDNVRP